MNALIVTLAQGGKSRPARKRTKKASKKTAGEKTGDGTAKRTRKNPAKGAVGTAGKKAAETGTG